MGLNLSFQREDRTYVIAEIGVNHNGSLELADQLVRAAHEAGADAVKFQIFSAQKLAHPSAELAKYQEAGQGGHESQLEMLKQLELSESELGAVKEVSDQLGLDFLASCFGVDDLRLLVDLGTSKIKIASSELTNIPLLQEVGRSGLPVILSTGMATLSEVEMAVTTLYKSGLRSDHLSLLQCTSRYPAEPDVLNLRAIGTLATRFQVRVGFSDHSAGILFAPISIALGATIIEKHLTLNRELPGPDHNASIEPQEFSLMVRNLRAVEKALGSGEKLPADSEFEVRKKVRKSIVSRTAITEGDFFTAENLTTMRPGTGIPAERWEELLGTRAARSYRVGEFIEL